MKKILVFTILLIAVFIQAEDWKISGTSGLNVNQSYYSDNWDAGESGSFNWIANVDLKAEKQMHDKFLSKNKLLLEFGQTHTQNKDTDNWEKPSKTTDNIEFESLGLFTLNSYVDPFAAFKFKSQFLDESMPEETKSVNPMTLTESFGVSRFFIKNDVQEFSGRFGGAFKQNINSHDEIDNTNNGGLELVADYSIIFSEKNADFKSSLTLYKALYNSESDDLEGTPAEDYWEETDIDWQNTLTYKLSSFINIKFSTQLLYDREISAKGRFKQNSSIGLSYKFL